MRCKYEKKQKIVSLSACVGTQTCYHCISMESVESVELVDGGVQKCVPCTVFIVLSILVISVVGFTLMSNCVHLYRIRAARHSELVDKFDPSHAGNAGAAAA